MVTRDIYIDSIPITRYAMKSRSTAQADCSPKTDFYKAFWIFIMGSVAGFAVETIWCLFRNGRIESRSSMVFGPFTVVYGLGALVLYMGTRFAAKKNILHIFVLGAAASTVVEYVCSLFQEALFGSVSWDYSSQPFNIGGRVSLLYSVFWGLLAILWLIAIQPAFETLISKISMQIYKPLTMALAVFIILDVAVSIAAVARWGMRLDGIQSVNLIASTLDRLFPNEFMTKVYPNMLW